MIPEVEVLVDALGDKSLAAGMLGVIDPGYAFKFAAYPEEYQEQVINTVRSGVPAAADYSKVEREARKFGAILSAAGVLNPNVIQSLLLTLALEVVTPRDTLADVLMKAWISL